MLSWGCKNNSKAAFLLLPPFEGSTRGRERIFQYERIRGWPCFPKDSNNSTDVNGHSNEDSHYCYFPWARGDSKSSSVALGAPPPERPPTPHPRASSWQIQRNRSKTRERADWDRLLLLTVPLGLLSQSFLQPSSSAVAHAFLPAPPERNSLGGSLLAVTA